MKHPRILFLADINSPHTQKWASSMANKGFEIGIFSLNKSNKTWFSATPNVTCLHKPSSKNKLGVFQKLFYLFALPKLLYILFKFKPNIVHAHYATSYGLLGALTAFNPLIVSVWGSDVLEFPKKSLLHKLILKFVFYKAANICATSSLLEKEINRLTKKSCTIIPFGVDLENFYAQVTKDKNRNAFVFGCTKYFESVYNIDKIISAFYLLTKKYSAATIKLHLIGNGSLKADLVNQAEKLGLLDKVIFVGEVENTKIPIYLNQFDVLINVSEYESFGVSIAEAMACKVPVIVSNAEGFKDLIPNSSLGLITTTEVESIFNCMEYYWLNAEARRAHAQNSFLRVKEFFDIKQNVTKMEAVYFSQLQQSV